MDTRKYTQKTTQALVNAQSLAREYGNQEIAQVHLFHALIQDDEGLIPQLLRKMNKNIDGLRADALSAVKALPKVNGGESFFGSQVAKAVEIAEKQAKTLGDAFLSVEHIFYGLLEAPDKTLKKLFTDYGVTQNEFMQANRAIPCGNICAIKSKRNLFQTLRCWTEK